MMQREDPRMRFYGYAPYMPHKEKVGISSGPIQRRDSFTRYFERYLSDLLFFQSSHYSELRLARKAFLLTKSQLVFMFFDKLRIIIAKLIRAFTNFPHNMVYLIQKNSNKEV
ncbi:hypothetical protein AVEN_152888-1 [Araneus ventricosus]|uniref:Uncharacterized protein n=1 Tax=Araneus ventricosus TaxID=182803 RepID=A0A4Y2AFD1_ARAVE|nr:hypothetical protein AVEN_152888-1 [Araneus ventricosus]